MAKRGGRASETVRGDVEGPSTVRTVKRARTAGRSAGSRSLRRRSRHSRQSGVADRAEFTEIEDRADLGWVEWGGELIWAVGFTSGGAPFGLRPSDFSPTDLEARLVADSGSFAFIAVEGQIDCRNTRRDGRAGVEDDPRAKLQR